MKPVVTPTRHSARLNAGMFDELIVDNFAGGGAKPLSYYNEFNPHARRGQGLRGRNSFGQLIDGRLGTAPKPFAAIGNSRRIAARQAEDGPACGQPPRLATLRTPRTFAVRSGSTYRNAGERYRGRFARAFVRDRFSPSLAVANGMSVHSRNFVPGGTLASILILPPAPGVSGMFFRTDGRFHLRLICVRFALDTFFCISSSNIALKDAWGSFPTRIPCTLIDHTFPNYIEFSVKKWSYYNDFNPHACEWARNLIKAGLVSDGLVDCRSITEVQPSDLKEFTQCHFFSGILGWPLALRLAGWPDDRPVITGSCPCPPFSSAGKKKACPECKFREVIPHPRKTGIFACVECAHEWFADGRHLWPEMHRIVSGLAGPLSEAPVFGEQVGGADGLIWLAGVRTTLEELGRAVGAADLCGASVGAPHIRQRLFWMAHAEIARGFRNQCGCNFGATESSEAEVSARGVRTEQRAAIDAEPKRNGGNGRLADARHDSRARSGQATRLETSERSESGEHDSSNGLDGGLGNGIVTRLEGHAGNGDPTGRPEAVRSTAAAGAWSDFYIVHCRDDKYRRIGSDAAPLAHGIPRDTSQLVSRLEGLGLSSKDARDTIRRARRCRLTTIEGFGNAIIPQLAAEFISAAMEAISETAGAS